MTFWDGVKKAGEMGYQAVREKGERIEHYKERYDRLDDKALYQKWKTSHGDVQLACMFLLKERGYIN